MFIIFAEEISEPIDCGLASYAVKTAKTLKEAKEIANSGAGLDCDLRYIEFTILDTSDLGHYRIVGADENGNIIWSDKKSSCWSGHIKES